MRKLNRILSLVLVFTMLFSAFSVSFAEDLLGIAPASKVVIIHTNDVHGQIDGYAKVAARDMLSPPKGFAFWGGSFLFE